MKSIWKWVLVFLGVFVVGFCVAVPLFLRFMFGFNRFGMMGGRGFRPMMGYRGFGFMHFGGFLIPLLVLGLVVVAVVWFMRRNSRLHAASPAAPAGFVSSVPVDSAVPAVPAEPVSTSPCPHCGNPVQPGWVACPHCGEKL
jgi:hypothetical protein